MTDQADLRKRLNNAGVVDELSEAECTQLLAMIETVRRSRLKAMLGAIDEALDHLPRLVRGPAKKILLG